MTITIKLNTDNAAFQDGNYTYELGHLLDKAQGLVLAGEKGKTNIRDSNGNTVGSVTVTGR